MDDFAQARLVDEEPPNPFDLKVLVLYAAARFRVQIAIFAVTGAVLGLLAGAAQPNIYTTNPKLRFQASVRQLLSDEAAFGVDSGDLRRSSTAVEEELELLNDPVIYERVVDQFGAREILKVEDPRAGDGGGASMPVKLMHALQASLLHLKGLDDPCPDGETSECRQAAVESLIANTKLKSIRRTNIIDVTFSSTSPAKAKRIADELLLQFRARHREEYEAQGQLETLQTNKRVAFESLQEARQKAAEFKAQCGYWDLDNDFAACQEEILLKTREEANIKQRAELLKGQVSSLEQDLNIRASDGGEAGGEDRRLNPAYRSAVSQLGAYEREIQEIDLKPNPGAISVRRRAQLTENVKKLQAALQRGEIPKYASDSALMELEQTDDPAIAEMRGLLATYKADLSGAVIESEAVRDRLEQLRAQRETMEECRGEHTRLKANVDLAEAKYLQIRGNEKNLSSLAVMDQEKRSNLSVFRPARMPVDKDGPQRSKPLMVALIAGLVSGLGLAVLRQLLDARVRYRETVENSLGLRVICVVPDLLEEPASTPGAPHAA